MKMDYTKKYKVVVSVYQDNKLLNTYTMHFSPNKVATDEKLNANEAYRKEKMSVRLSCPKEVKNGKQFECKIVNNDNSSITLKVPSNCKFRSSHIRKNGESTKIACSIKYNTSSTTTIYAYKNGKEVAKSYVRIKNK